MKYSAELYENACVVLTLLATASVYIPSFSLWICILVQRTHGKAI